MTRHVCIVCNYSYNPAIGDPEHGIAPGTPFDELPTDWRCPDCGAGTSEFISELVPVDSSAL